MEYLIGFSLFVVFLGIPTTMLITAGNSYGAGMRPEVIIVKLVFTFVGYFIGSIVTAFFFVTFVLSDTFYPSSSDNYSTRRQIFGIVLIYVYAAAGYLLCAFIKGEFFNPANIFRRKKPISLFDHKS